MPFALHQLVEYLLALVLATSSVHVARGGLLVGGGAAFAVLALTAPGPLGALRVRRVGLHATLDVVVPVLMALAPALPALRPGAAGIAVVELAALAWIRLATLTRYPRPTPATAPGTGAGPGRVDGGTVPGVARRAGRGTARLRRAWRSARDAGP
ncbi:MAG TPA: hypothetical protein VMB72_15745 [Acidimicrobiales bacterium]|nr:hypothetical protein [Acidimicrobiales bacterium]